MTDTESQFVIGVGDLLILPESKEVTGLYYTKPGQIGMYIHHDYGLCSSKDVEPISKEEIKVLLDRAEKK
jgi:hypothetical protein